MSSEDIGRKLWEKHGATVLQHSVSFVMAPSGFGKSQMLRYGVKINHGLYIGSDTNLFDGSILENIELSDQFGNIDYQQFISDIRYPLDEKLENINEKLSTGQKQRIVFLRSLSTLADLVVFDETISGLESELIDKLVFLCCQISVQERKKFVFVIHNYIPKLRSVKLLKLYET